MEVRVRYFAAARDLCGCGEETLSLPDTELSAEGLLGQLCERHPQLTAYRGRMRLAVNDEFVGATDRVQDGDEVAVMPPVAGGVDMPCSVRTTPLSLDEAFASVRHPGAGGITLFVGIVRDNADGKSVARLDYEAHEKMAEQEMARVLDGVVAEHPGARLHVQHRVGQLAVGDAAVIVAASAAHRGDAFDACRKAIDRIKDRVPIWKKEWDVQGAPHWVNLDGSG